MCNGTFAQRFLVFLWGALGALHTMHTVIAAVTRSHLHALWCEEGGHSAVLWLQCSINSRPSVTRPCVVSLCCAPSWGLACSAPSPHTSHFGYMPSFSLHTLYPNLPFDIPPRSWCA